MDKEVITTMTQAVREQVRHLLAQADAVLIGAGWGLAHAVGVPSDDAPLEEDFAALRQAGAATHAQAQALLEPADQRYWGYWFRRIKALRFDFPCSAAHDALLALVRGKDHFILTSTAFGLFSKSQADPYRIMTAQGDYVRLQCAANCRDETVSILPALKRALPHIEEATLAMPEAYIPRCPHCGSVMTPNVWRQGQSFCQSPYRQQSQRLRQFLAAHADDRLLLFEIGVGYSQPMLIRFPFEQLASSRPQATLIRLNTQHPLCTEENRSKALCLSLDAREALLALAQ